MQAAQRAERHRKSAKSQYYREQVGAAVLLCPQVRHALRGVTNTRRNGGLFAAQYRQAHKERENQKTAILMEKHALSPPRNSAEF